ncbi:protein kinase domain-containing protein [Natronospira sp.]|uniref:protein kinase domain-containing protein n=1 Tax=Natronospira sp. TaxID=2024970 RepID=UPI00387381AE
MLDRSRQRDGLLALLLCLLVGVGGLAGSWQGLDARITHWGTALATPRAPEADIAIVEVDDLKAHGDADHFGEQLRLAIGQARKAGAEEVVVLLPAGWKLPAAESSDGWWSDGNGSMEAGWLLGLSAQPGTSRPLSGLPHYLLGSSLTPPESETGWLARLQQQLGLKPGQVPGGRVLLPQEASGTSAAGFTPLGEHGRFHAALKMGEGLLPALSLQLAARLDGQWASSRQLAEVADNHYHFRPFPYRPDQLPLPRLDFEQLLSGELDPDQLANHAVVIGPVEIDGKAVTRLTAEHAAAIHAGHLYQQPDWGPWAPWLGLLLVAGWLSLVLPRLNLSLGVYSGLLLVLALFGLQLLLPTIRLLHLELAMPLMALIAGHGALLAKRRLDYRREGILMELSEANRQLAESLRRQGQTDAAFERLRRCEPRGPVLESLYELALDLERRREFARAQTVLRWLDEHSPDFRDARTRIAKLSELETKTALGPRNGPGGTLVLDEEGVQKPMLGRYEIKREIGKGAMGVVYLGHDPRIGRTVAVKTMALAQEFEGADLEQVTERFFREAETAGRLQHPNIVTIYDVGEEADLAYIAMDFLDGIGLQDHTEPDRLLPATQVCNIIIQVAEALDYAHGQGVVHRDIKPANMIWLPDAERVVLTDFGVACLTDSRRTKTGTILGTPSYMSPEQVLGRKVDGRSDLFSLGATLYQLLRGELPFQGEPLATLLYKIANDKTPNVCRQRPDLPPCMGRIVKRALEKKPEKRFQSGTEMAAALRRCRREVAARLG